MKILNDTNKKIIAKDKESYRNKNSIPFINKSIVKIELEEGIDI